MKKKYLLAVLCLTAVLAVAGCGNEKKEEAESTPTPTPTQEAETLEMTETPEVGEKTDTSQSIQLTNETGTEVTSVWLRVSGQEEWGEELVQGSFTISEAESFNLNYEPQETAEDGTTAPVEAWDLSVGYEDGSYVVMNQVDLQAVTEMTMCWEDDVAFVKYQDPDTQEEVSTKEDEIARQQAAAEAAAQAQAEAEAAEKAAQEEAQRQAEEEAAAQAEAEAAAAAQAQAEAEAAAAAQAQAEAEAAAAAQAQAEAEAAAAAQAQAEAEAAAAAAAQQQQQQQQQEENCANSSGNIVVNPDGSWYVAE